MFNRSKVGSKLRADYPATGVKIARRFTISAFPRDHIGRQIAIDGYYEIRELGVLKAWLRSLGRPMDSLVAIDAGANIGNHAVALAPLFKTIIAYEPNPTTFQLLRVNAALRTNIIPVQYGLSDIATKARLSFTLDNLGEASISRLIPRKGPIHSAEVDLIPLDDCPHAAAQPIGFVKLDLEGHEMAFLDGARQTICTHKPILAFEQHPDEISNGTTPVIEALRAMGYSEFAVLSHTPPQANWLPSILKRIVTLFMPSASHLMRFDRLEKSYYPLIIAIPHAVPAQPST